MKFKNDVDKLQYDLLGLNEVEVRKRLNVLTKSKDHKASRTMKNNWRRNKKSMLKGIKKWNRSTAGKRFHRALGRFNALRESVSYYNHELTPGQNFVKLSMVQVNDALLSLSSIETHLYLELQYYEADAEAMVQFLDLLYAFVQDSSVLKIELIKAFVSGELEEENYNLLTDMIQFFQDPKMYVYAKRDLVGKRNDDDDERFRTLLKSVAAIDMTMPSREIYETIDQMMED
jgi:hypothetical protein